MIFKPIVAIFSLFKDIEVVPVQPAGAEGIRGKVEVYGKYAEGISASDGFSHIILIYRLNLSKGYSLLVKPFLHNSGQVVIATRAPKRPNQISIFVVKIRKIPVNIIDVVNLDIVDGTPLLGIKPYVSFFDNVKDEKNRWLADRTGDINKSETDGRFK